MVDDIKLWESYCTTDPVTSDSVVQCPTCGAREIESNWHKTSVDCTNCGVEHDAVGCRWCSSVFDHVRFGRAASGPEFVVLHDID